MSSAQGPAREDRSWPPRGAAIPLALFALSLTIRLAGAVWPPGNRLYDVDELTLSDSAHYLFFSQIPASLAWPSCTVLMPLALLYGIGLFLQPPMLSALAARRPD